jgi:hypothetical protein
MAAYSPGASGDTWQRVSPSPVSPYVSEAGSFIATPLPPLPAVNLLTDFESQLASTEIPASTKQQALSVEHPATGVATSAARSFSVRGVVDNIEGNQVSATLFYGGRENPFLFDLLEINAAGAGYPGAIFEILVGSALDYKIVHLGAEEEAAREAAPPPDLSFLDS